MKKDSQPVLITFCVYPNAIGPKMNPVTGFRIPLFNMTKEQADKVRGEIEKNPYVGTVTIHLDNGCHI